MPTKKAPKKSPDKEKTPEGPNRPKHKQKKRTPSKVIKSTKQQNEMRRRAVERAAAQLRRFAIPFDLGDSIIICTRHKVIFAFDHPEDSLSGLRANAEASGSVLIHFDAESLKHTGLFDKMVVAGIDRKPVYAGKKGGVVPPVKLPVLETAKRMKKAVKKEAKRQVRKAATRNGNNRRVSTRVA